MQIKYPKIRIDSFWSYQILGWLIFFASEISLTIVLSKFSDIALIIKLIRVLFGILLTCGIRLCFTRINYKSFSIISLILISFLVSIIAALVFYFLNVGIILLFYTVKNPYSYFQITKIINDFLLYNLPLFFGWSALYFTIKFWLEWDNEKTLAEEANALAHDAQIKMLRYQMNPHFLFNTLNTIRALIDENEKTARSLVTELSDFLKYSLISRNQPRVNLREELEAVKHYLAIEKRRYEDNLEVTYDIDPATDTYNVLSFLVHPLIDNAIKFGMQTSSMPLKIKISASLKNDALVLQIINSGKLIPKTGNNENQVSGGLENVRARLNNSFPNKHRFNLFEKDGCVYAVLEIFY